jgi:CheY-like chemotaxis protein
LLPTQNAGLDEQENRLNKEIVLCAEPLDTSLVYQSAHSEVILLDRNGLIKAGHASTRPTLYVYEGEVDHDVYVSLMSILTVPGIELMVVTESIQAQHEKMLHVAGVVDVVLRKGVNQQLMGIVLEIQRQSSWREPFVSASKPKVLVIDDEQFWIDRLSDLCGPLFDVRGVASQDCLFKNIDEFYPDLICLDIVLGAETNGFSILDRIMKAKGRDAKVVFCSSLKFARYIVDAYKQGASGYIQKPFSSSVPHKLMNILRRIPRET